MKYIITVFSFFYSLLIFGQLSAEQLNKVDSLKIEIEKAQHDSTIINSWRTWDNIIYPFDPNLDYQLNEKIDSLCGLNLLKNTSKKEKSFFLEQKASALNILAGINNSKGDLLLTQKYSFESLKIRQELGDTVAIAGSLNGIGIFYHTQQEYDKAILYLDSAANIYMQVNNLDGLGMCFNNLGLAYMEQGKNDSAMFYFDECLISYQKLGDETKFAAIYNNKGLIYKNLEEYDSALMEFDNSIKNCKKFGNLSILANSLNNSATVYLNMDAHKKAIEFATEAYDIGKLYGMTTINSEANRLLYLCHKNLNQSAKALKSYEIYNAYEDTLRNENDNQVITDQKYAFEYGIKAAKDSISAAEAVKVSKAELLAEKAETSRQKQQSYFLFAGLILVVLLGIFVLNRLKISQKQKTIIAEKKDEVDMALLSLEEKNKEITDSINYAKRIQTAILPSAQRLSEALPEHFITYIPKDIVAGDFYWLQEIGDKTLFAACDCTGHGVPGAMVSVVCNNSLNRSVKEFGLNNPAEILDKTRELIIEEFSKSDEDVKDGMDIALCCIKGNKLTFSGAHNPLWIIRKNSNEIEEIKGDKQPVGVFEKAKAFSSHEIILEKGDSIYIFTDGYSDQFGGEKGKKLKASNFKSLILSLQKESLINQKERLRTEFDEWKGPLEQLDDVCIIGMRY